MHKPALLVLAAAVGALPLGFLAANFGIAAPHAATQTAALVTDPDFAGLAKSGRRRGRC